MLGSHQGLDCVSLNASSLFCTLGLLVHVLDSDVVMVRLRLGVFESSY